MMQQPAYRRFVAILSQKISAKDPKERVGNRRKSQQLKERWLSGETPDNPMLFDALSCTCIPVSPRFFLILARPTRQLKVWKERRVTGQQVLILDDESLVFSMGRFDWLYPHQFTVAVPQRLCNDSHATALLSHEIIVASDPLDGGVTHAKRFPRSPGGM